MWGPDIPPTGLTAQSALRQLLAAFAGFAMLALVIKNYGIPERPGIRREFPYDGLVKELGGVEELKVRFRHFTSPYDVFTKCFILLGKPGGTRLIRRV